MNDAYREACKHLGARIAAARVSRIAVERAFIFGGVDIEALEAYMDAQTLLEQAWDRVETLRATETSP